jgi:hypothetical protein
MLAQNETRYGLRGDVILNGLTLALIALLRDPIERHVLYTPLAAPVMIALYLAAVIGPWWVLGMRGKKDA